MFKTPSPLLPVVAPNNPLGCWKDLGAGGTPTTNPYPYVTVSGIAYDKNGNFPLLYRSDKVRSARNCWSVPSGLHETGFKMEDQFATELHEELNLEPYPETADVVAVYENIAIVDGYHWVILLMTIQVVTLETLMNKEPDKHPEIRIVNIRDLGTKAILNLPWAPSLGDAIQKHWRRLSESVTKHLA